jgi:mRNA interferase MazF
MIISVDKFNKGPADLVIAIPITRTPRQIASHVFVAKGEGGLDSDSYIMVEAIRSISKERLLSYRGDLAYSTIEQVQHLLRVLLNV